MNEVENYMEKEAKETLSKFYLNLISLFFLILAVVGVIYLCIMLYQDGGKCIGNPIEYYHNLGDDKCTCLSGNGIDISQFEATKYGSSNVVDIEGLKDFFNYDIQVEE